MISASVMDDVPWGFVCGYPTRNGKSNTGYVAKLLVSFCFTSSGVFLSFYITHPRLLSLGDMYGGAHYMQSSSADMTPQGMAIRDASIRFGNGRTLPFTPCKKGFIPYADGERKYACPLHNKERRKRVLAVGGSFRKGELDLHAFWKRHETTKEALEEDEEESGDTTADDRKGDGEK